MIFSKLLKKLKTLFAKKKTQPVTLTQRIERKPTYTTKGSITTVQIKTIITAQKNIQKQKQSTYKYSKFFKHRQPTTARKLWKPHAKPEEEKQKKKGEGRF